jgi:hypothetical protein
MSTRREFITLLGGGAAWPLTASAQQPAMPTIGLLGSTTPSAESQRIAAFMQRLRELGWIEGRNVTIESVSMSAKTRFTSWVSIGVARSCCARNGPAAK